MNEELFSLLLKNQQISVFLIILFSLSIIAFVGFILKYSENEKYNFLVFFAIVSIIISVVSLVLLILNSNPSYIIMEYLLSKKQYENPKDLYYETIEVLTVFKKLKWLT